MLSKLTCWSWVQWNVSDIFASAASLKLYQSIPYKHLQQWIMSNRILQHSVKITSYAALGRVFTMHIELQAFLLRTWISHTLDSKHSWLEAAISKHRKIVNNNNFMTCVARHGNFIIRNAGFWHEPTLDLLLSENIGVLLKADRFWGYLWTCLKNIEIYN